MADEPLFDAIRAGDLPTVDRIVSISPAQAQASNASGLSALVVAAYYGQWPIVDRLLATHPDLDLFEAAIVGDTERVVVRLDEIEREREIERETARGRRRAWQTSPRSHRWQIGAGQRVGDGRVPAGRGPGGERGHGQRVRAGRVPLG